MTPHVGHVIIEDEWDRNPRICPRLESLRVGEGDEVASVVDGRDHAADELETHHAIDPYALHRTVIDVSGETDLVAQPQGADCDLIVVDKPCRAMPLAGPARNRG